MFVLVTAPSTDFSRIYDQIKEKGVVTGLEERDRLLRGLEPFVIFHLVDGRPSALAAEVFSVRADQQGRGRNRAGETDGVLTALMELLLTLSIIITILFSIGTFRSPRSPFQSVLVRKEAIQIASSD